MPIQISVGNLKALRQDIQNVTTSLKALDSNLIKIQQSGSSLDRLFGSNQGFKDFIADVNKLSPANGKALESVGNGLNALTKAMGRLSSLAAPSNTLILAIKNTLVQTFAQLNTLTPLDKNITRSINSLQYILNTFVRIGIEGVPAGLGASVTKIVEVISQTFSSLAKASSEVAGTSGTDAFSTLTSKVNQLVNFVPTLSTLGKSLPQIPSGLFAGLKLRFSGDSQIKDLKKLFDFFKFVSESLAGISGKISGENDLGALDTLSEVITRLSKAIPKIQEAAKALPKGTGIFSIDKLLSVFGKGQFGQLKQFFAFFKFIAQQSAGIAKNVGKEGDLSFLEKLAPSLTQLSKAIPRILDTAKTLPKGGFLGIGKFKSLKEFFSFVRAIGKELGNIPQTVTNVPEVFNQLVELAGNLKTDAFKNAKLDGFEDFAKKLGKGLEEFNNVKVDAERIKAVAAVSGSLGNILGSGGGSGGGFLASIAQGIGVGFGVTISNSLLKAISDFKNFKANAIESLAQVGEKLKSLGDGFISFGQNLVNNLGINKLLKSKGADIATDFEDLTNQLQVFAKNIPTKEAQDFADEIGIKYPLSANQALQATLDLAKAGLEFPDIKKVLPSSADLAALDPGGDLGRSTQALIVAAKTFDRFSGTVKGSFQNIQEAANIYAAAADVSTASTTEIYDAVAAVGPIANQAGLTLQQVAAASAQLSDINIKGAEAGTALRSALTALQRPQARQELQRLGVAMYNTDGSARDFNQVLKELGAVYKANNFSQKQVTDSLSQLADVHGRTALQVLLLNGGLDKTITAMNGTASAGDKATSLMSSLKGIMVQLGGSVDTLLKKAFLPLVERFFKPAATLALNFVNAILKIPQPVLNAAVTMIGLGAAIATLVGSTTILLGLLTKGAGVFIGFAASTAKVLLNLPQLILMASSLAATFAALLPVVIIAGSILAALGTTVETVFYTIENNIGGAGDAFIKFKDTLTTLYNEVFRIGGRIVTAFKAVFGGLFSDDLNDRASTLVKFFNRLSETASNFVDQLKKIKDEDIARVFTEIYRPVEAIINAVRGVSGGIFHLLFGDAEQGTKEINSGLSSLLREITLFLDKVTGLNFVKSIFKFQTGDIAGGIEEFVKSVVKSVIEFIQNHADLIAEVGTKIVDFFFNPVKIFVTVSKIFGLDQITAILEPISNAITSIFSGIFKIITGLIKGDSLTKILGNIFGETGKNIGKTLDTIINIIKNILGGINTNIIQPFVKNVPAAIENIVGFFQQLFTNISNGAGQLITTVQPIIEGVFTGIKNFLVSAAPILNVFANAVGNVFEFLAGLPSVLLDFTRIGPLFSNLLTNIARTLGNLPSILGPIIQTIFDEIGGFVSRFVPDLLARFSQAFTDIVVGIGPFIVAAFNTISGLISEGIVRGIDITGTIIQVVGNIIKGIADAVLNLLPNLFTSIANGIQNSTVANVIKFIADIAKRLVSSLTSFLNFPIQLLGSFVKGIASIFDLLEKLGISKSAVIAVLAALTFYFSGLATAIKDLVAAKLSSLISSVSSSINNFIQKISAFAQTAYDKVIKVKEAFLDFANKGMLAASEAIGSGLGKITNGLFNLSQMNVGQVFSSLSSGLKGIASAGFNTIVTGIRGIGTAVTSLAGALAPLIGPIALLTTLKAAFDGLAKGIKDGNAGSGIMEFFRSFGEQVLGFLGLSDKVGDFEKNLTLVGEIVKSLINKLNDLIQGFFAQLDKALGELHIGGFGNFAKEYFGAQDLFKEKKNVDQTFDAIAKKAEEVGGTVGQVITGIIADTTKSSADKLKDITNVAGLKGKLDDFKDLIFDAQTAIEKGSTGVGDSFFAEFETAFQKNKDLVGKNAEKNAQFIIDRFNEKLTGPGGLGALTPDEFKGVADALIASGNLETAFAGIKDKFNLDTLFGNIVDILPSDQQAKATSAYINRLFELGVQDLRPQEKDVIANQIASAVTGGAIARDKGVDFLTQLGLDPTSIQAKLSGVVNVVQPTFEKVTKSIRDLYTEARNTSIGDIIKKNLPEAETNQAILDLGNNIEDTVSKVRDAKLAELAQQKDSGAISQEEYNKALAQTIQEAEIFKGIALGEEIDRIAKEAGKTIPIEKAAEQIKNLAAQLQNLKNVPPGIRDELNKLYADLASGIIKGDDFAAKLEDITNRIKNAQQAGSDTTPTGFVDFTAQGNSDLAPQVDNPDLAAQVDDAAQSQKEIDKIQEDISRKTEDFNLSQKRADEDNALEEQKALDKIQEIRDKGREEEMQKVADFTKQQERNEQDHKQRILDISRDTSEQLEDAVASRDASAAQRAEKEGRKKVEDENNKYELEKQRRIEDFNDQLAQDRRKREESIKAAQQDYNDLVAKHALERSRKREDFQRDIAELNSKLTTEQNTKLQFNAQQALAQQAHNAALGTLIQSGLNNALNLFGNFMVGLGNLSQGATISTAFGGLQQAVANIAQTPLGQTVSGLVGALGTLTSAGSTTGGAGQSSSGITATQFAKGGNVRKGRLIEVSEPKTGTELYHAGDRTFMIPGANGYIQPPAKGNPYGSAGNQNLTISLGGITINGGNADANELVAKVEQQVIPKITQAVRALQR